MAQEPHQKRDLYAEVTDRIVNRLEQGVAPWACPWRRDGDGGCPRNGASGHRYRGVNLILTAMSVFGTSRWYTFRQAKALGGYVRKGEKATPVIYWRFMEVEAKD
ncbi:MAG: ArdC family protein [Pseudomonadota bacterium]